MIKWSLHNATATNMILRQNLKVHKDHHSVWDCVIHNFALDDLQTNLFSGFKLKIKSYQGLNVSSCPVVYSL